MLKNHAAELGRYNHQSEPFGLTLSEQALERLSQARFQVLEDTRRIEFGEGILGKLITAFCDSPYLSQIDYEETLLELQELFYLFKNECPDFISDDELIQAMHLIYQEVAKGSLDYLSGIDRKTIVQIAITGSLEGTELERPVIDFFFDEDL